MAAAVTAAAAAAAVEAAAMQAIGARRNTLSWHDQDVLECCAMPASAQTCRPSFLPRLCSLDAQRPLEWLTTVAVTNDRLELQPRALAACLNAAATSPPAAERAWDPSACTREAFATGVAKPSTYDHRHKGVKLQAAALRWPPAPSRHLSGRVPSQPPPGAVAALPAEPCQCSVELHKHRYCHC